MLFVVVVRTHFFPSLFFFHGYTDNQTNHWWVFVFVFCQREEPTVFTVVVAVVRVENKPLWFFIRIENQLFREGLFVLGLSVC